MFEELNLTVSIFLFPWIMCIFSNTFPLDLSARIWDSYFLYGDWYLMKVCLAISSVIHKQILSEQQDSFEMLMIMFKNID
jgi:hypothetical protein